MLRVTKGKTVKGKGTVIVLFILLAALNVELSNLLASRFSEVSIPEAQTSSKIFAVMSPVNEYSQKNADPFNVTLWIKDWKAKNAFENLNVTVYDLKRKLASSSLSNKTGYVDLKFLNAGSYVISVQSKNRTVGYQKINITKSEKIVVKTWAYDLNLTLLNEIGKPLANHTVFLYDQMVFRASKFTIGSDDVRRTSNYTLMTDEVGPLVNQTKTDRNGTARFIGVWNGTYRITIAVNESWIGEYVLGKYVLKLQEPASGEFILKLQEPTSLKLICFRASFALKFISESNVPFRNATVYIRNRLGHLLFKDVTNRTGFVEHKNLYVTDGVYTVSARYGNRTVGYSVINVTKTEIFTVEGWAYNLTVRCVDQENKILPDHVVLLYDQLVFYSPTNITAVANRTGLLVNSTRTDRNGTAHFKDLWNGTYRIRVMGGELIGEQTVKLQNLESVLLKCNKTYLVLRFFTGADEPLSNATVQIYDSVKHLIFKDYTDENGYIRHDGIYLDNYTVFAEWMGTEVWSGVVDVHKDRELTVRCSVFRLMLRVTDPFGNPLPYADVILRKKITSWRYIGSPLELETDETGYVSRLLPSGIYEASYFYGIYSSMNIINLVEDYGETVRCNVQLSVLLLTLSVASPMVALTLLLERKRLRKPVEIKRYKNMLSKLESIYKSGLVEYKVYRKLREEYEAKLMELGGREMR